MDALLLYPKSGYDYGVGIAPPTASSRSGAS